MHAAPSGTSTRSSAPAGRDKRSLGRAFWRFWTSNALGDLGDGILLVAIPLFAVQLTRSPLLIAGITVAGRLPWLFATLPAGAIADRVERRRLMASAHGIRVALLVLLVGAIANDAVTITILYVVTLLLGTAEVVFTAGVRPITPMLVEPEDLTRANSRIEAARTLLNEFLGPPLAGALVALGFGVAFGASALGYAIALAALVLMPGSFRVERTDSMRLRSEIAEGITFLWRHRVLKAVTIMVAVMAGGWAAWMSVLVLFVTGPMSVSEFGYGVLLAVMAAGALLGAAAVNDLQRRVGRSKVLFINVVGTAVMYGVPAVTTNVVAVGVASFLGGMTGVMWNVVSVSLSQTLVPPHLLGRVSAASRLLSWGTLPLGALLGGFVGEGVGLRPVFAFAAASTLLLLLLRRTVTERAITRAEASVQ